MSERKVLNKYFPPDFDPSKIPRLRKPKDRQEVIRLMAPFSMRCNTCGEYIYAGKKFNGRKETVQGEDYYGVRIFRFYIKCPVCSSEITFKTDPKNADYTVEHGVSRNFEPWREGKVEDPDADPLAHILEEEGVEASDDEDPMKALEKRTQDAKREMEIMDALQDIRTRNARIDRVNADDIMQRHLEKGKDKLTAEQEEQLRLEEEDEALVRRHFGKDMASLASPPKLSHSQSASSPKALDGSPVDSIPRDISIKRARYELDDDRKAGDDREPDAASLLSEAAREKLASASAPVRSSGPATGSKRKKGTSAFGLVRKKL